MRKIPVFLATLFSLALAAAIAVNPVEAGIEDTTWLGSMHSWGIDSYYGASVYGYKESTNATLLVEVKNHLSTRMNISEVIVGFDWNKNYTNALDIPVRMEPDETRFFTVSLTVPNTTIASNMYLHGYTVYVKHVNATGSLAGTMTKAYTSDPDFAVYSKVQADAREMSRIIAGMTMPDFNSTSATLKWSQAANETTLGGILYSLGDFAGAKTHYSNAITLRNQAISSEQTTTGGIQDAQLTLIQAQAKYFEAQANYLNGLSSMWILIGVAAVLFAIGYIIRGFAALRKPATAATT